MLHLKLGALKMIRHSRQFDRGLGDWTQAESVIWKPAEPIQNTTGPLMAQDNEFHGSAYLYVWETQSLAK